MCGITGIISKNLISEGIVEKMTDTIIHRGPDGYGYYYGENFTFGHRRLAIIDLTDAGHQPMEYMNRYVITYNGEVYNYLELKEELVKLGYNFKSDTDTEVIMAAFDCWGAECLKRFNGMWAFVIYDKEKKEFFISRDRFGKKPFYYYKDENTFVFASEIKAILEHPDIEAKADWDFLNDYLENGCKEYIKETAFKNIYRFDFSSYFLGTLEELLNDFEVKKYWEIKPNLIEEEFDENKAQEYAQKYYELLEDAVRIRLRADVKVGSALSGGLDSSSIVYLVNKLLKEQGKEELQETFSNVYKSSGTEDCDESKYIDILAQKLNVNSNQIEPNVQDIPKEHKKMIYALENPPENTLMSSWHTFKRVSNTDVKVTLDGQGADEQLAGYTYYFMNYLASASILEILQRIRHCSSIPFSKKHVLNGICLNVLKNIFGEKALNNFLKKTIKKYFEFNLNKQLSEESMSALITLIHYADHTSMAYSIESRMPFMDYRLVEFLASVPSCYKIHKGWTKYLARLAFDKKLPDEVCWRRDKMGWPIPEETWFNGPLKNWLYEKTNNEDILKKLNLSKSLLSKKRLNYRIKILNIIKTLEQYKVISN